MKNFKIWAVALLAVLGFASCDDHDCNEYDHSADLVGTWTCLTADYAEALVISADGSMVSTGVEDGEYWENIKGRIVVKDGKVEMTFEDNDNFKGHFDIIPGEAFSIFTDKGERLTYRYCANDLADEIVGMWVCNDGPFESKNDMTIQTFKKDGSVLFTGYAAYEGGFTLNGEGTYKVIGDLLIHNMPEENLVEGVSKYLTKKVIFASDATALGDIMTLKGYVANGKEEVAISFLRVKESLNLVGKKYSYNNVYISNVKGSDKEIDFMGYKFTFANMDGSRLDMVMKSALFGFEFPNANTISYSYQLNGITETYTLPLVVEGNKLTFKMSAKFPSLKDVVFYAFQDTDDCQLHLYIHQSSFVSFFTNMQAIMAAAVNPAFDINNPAAIDAIYNEIDAAVESINLSVVMK